MLAACHDSDFLADECDVTADNVIHVGGINADGLSTHVAVTRTGGEKTIDEDSLQVTDAENISWLVGPLKAGLEIT